MWWIPLPPQEVEDDGEPAPPAAPGTAVLPLNEGCHRKVSQVG